MFAGFVYINLFKKKCILRIQLYSIITVSFAVAAAAVATAVQMLVVNETTAIILFSQYVTHLLFQITVTGDSVTKKEKETETNRRCVCVVAFV